jgi:putative glycerol-1-phosphate prenyltransferase
VSNLVSQILHKQNTGEHSVALLIDPDDNHSENSLFDLISVAHSAEVDYFFIGGSLLMDRDFEQKLTEIKRLTDRPVIIFPGNNLQISEQADGILFLSLISGRNPEFLIGQHVVAAPILKKSAIEVIPTGYILIGNGHETAVGYMSQTHPIPANKPALVAATAMAGEYLGMKLIYLEAGSGARSHVSQEVVSKVRSSVRLPIIVGGGIRNADTAVALFQSGANIIVLGNGVLEYPELLVELKEKMAVRKKMSDVHE